MATDRRALFDGGAVDSVRLQGLGSFGRFVPGGVEYMPAIDYRKKYEELLDKYVTLAEKYSDLANKYVALKVSE